MLNKLSNNNKTKFNIINIILLGIILGRYAEFVISTIVLILFFFSKKKIPNLTKKTLVILIIIFIWSIISITINQYEISKFFQQFLLLGNLALAYSYILIFYKNKIHFIFIKYINIMYIVAILGILQFIIYFVFKIDILFFNLEGLKSSSNGSNIIRVSSILNEPGYLGTSLSPIIAYIIFNKNYFFKNKIKSINFFICYFLTFASISYTILALILLTKFLLSLTKKIRIIIVSFLLISIFFFKVYNSIKVYDGRIEDGFFSAIYLKLNETLVGSNSKQVDTFEDFNASTYALLVNKWVASNAPSRIFGTGLGTHQQNYYKLYTNNAYELYGLNSEDGYSLYNRIFSEFGYVGLFFLFLFLYKYLNTKNIINLSVLFFLLSIVLRGGHYTLYGTVFFFYIYYLTSQKKTIYKPSSE